MKSYEYARNLAEEIAKQIAEDSQFQPNMLLTRHYTGVRDDHRWEARFFKNDIEVRFPNSNVREGLYEWFRFDLEYMRILYKNNQQEA